MTLLKNIFLFILLSSEVFAQLPDTDIWMFDVKETQGKISFSNPVNITNREGYDNQPIFSPKGSYIYYTSIREDKQADIYRYSIKKKKTARFTKTPTSEYSPTYMTDGKNLSVVMVEKDSSQRLWKFPLSGKKPSLITDVDSVGYHTWLNKDTLALFVLTNPFSLQIADVKENRTITVAESIGRSMKKIPNQDALLFIKKLSADNWVFQTLHLKTLRTLSDVPSEDIPTVKGSEDFILTNAGLIMGKDSKLYRHKSESGKSEWVEIADFSSSGINNITRIAISNDNKKIAIVSSK